MEFCGNNVICSGQGEDHMDGMIGNDPINDILARHYSSHPERGCGSYTESIAQLAAGALA